jgi:hypothetical protein
VRGIKKSGFSVGGLCSHRLDASSRIGVRDKLRWHDKPLGNSLFVDVGTPQVREHSRAGGNPKGSTEPLRKKLRMSSFT